MKIPVTPPDFLRILEEAAEGDYRKVILPTLELIKKDVSSNVKTHEYLHWDKLRHLQPPKYVSTKLWWCAIKLIRRALYKPLPFNDKFGKPFVLAMPDILLRKLHLIDRNTASNIQGRSDIFNSNTRDTYLVRSLIEEAITSSQLEGASTTQKVAKEMLLTRRKPRDISEQMIYNNYQAMQFIREIKTEPLNTKIVLELHRILTQNTLENPKSSGYLRTSQDIIHVFDNRDQTILHTPPQAKELKHRLQKLCDFANDLEKETFFIHPIVKAIILHFMLAYDHPFVDGNGRTARALFYWYMARQNYWLMEFISISQIIKKSPGQYARAFLYTETDESDVTYFVHNQLDAIVKAVDALHEYINRQTKEINEVEQLFNKEALRNRLNYRQITIIKHALKHPTTHYQIEEHRQYHHVTYDTARTDLLNLAKLGLLLKRKTGKAFTFIVPTDLKKRISK